MAELMIILSLASPVVNAAREKLCSLATSEFLALWGVRKGIATLISSLANTKELLDRLEANEMNSSSPLTLKNWLEELQAAAYDADDLIESWATEYQQWKMNEQVQKLHLPFSLSNSLFVLSKSHSLKKIQKRIDKLIQDGQAYTTILGTRPTINNHPRETTALPNPVNISREVDEENIVKLLTADEGGSDGVDLSFVHILGMGGLGKTTLARNVCTVDRVKNYFNNTIIWISVTKNFNLEGIFREIVVAQQPANIIDHNVQSFSLNMLQVRTREILSGNRFLLVLDNLWNHESEYLDPLVAVLVLGGKGSKVLVTSRTKEVTRIIGSKPPYYLGCLGENESWSLFEKFAFPEHRNVRESDREEFGKYGREIVKKCQGLPLALKHIGALLLRKDLGFWRDIAKSQTWQVDTVDDEVLPALRLSYNHLSSPFHKQCFAYCSLFPKAYVYEKHELVKLWMAEAIIKPPNHERTEVIGNRYFKELSDRFFFERIGEQEEGTSEDDEGTSKADDTKYKMHDLIHDLAQVISSPFYCQVVKDARDFNKKARHISLLCDDVDQPTLEIVKNSKKLRTILLPGHHFKAFTEMPREVFHSLRYVRLLDLSSSTSLTKLPDSIGKLKLLRYLTGALHISKLENAVSAGEANLKGKEMIQQVVYEWTNSDLNLQDDATESKVLEDLEPHPRVLKELQICHYRGTEFPTWIREGRLQNLVSICLNHCTRIQTLCLGELPNLRSLRLKDLRELEEWQVDNNWRTSLGMLKISDCPKLERLPLIFLNLGVLKIKNCASLKIIPFGPIMFLTLVGNAVLKHCSEDYVEIEPSNDAPDEVPDLILSFKAKMINVKITNCPELEALPRNLQPQKLEISGCRSLSAIPDDDHTRRLSFLTLDACPDDTLVNMIPSTSTLLSLVISNIPNLVCLPKEPRLPRLEALNIHDCKDLVHLSDQGSRLFEGLTSLRALSIANCPELMTLPAEGLPTSLRYLSIVSCTKLESFGPRDVLRRLTSLHDLFIEDCPALQSFPEGWLPTSLLHLSIKRCPSLIERCHNEGHNLIQDIPDLEIE